MTMTRIAIAAAALAVVASTGARAQQAGANALQETNVLAVAGGGGGPSSIHESGSLYGTALVYAPPIATGNTCALGISSGLAVRDVGIALGGTYRDQGCRDLEKAAALHTLAITTHSSGLETASLALLCASFADVADAVYAGTGLACPGRQADVRYAAARGVMLLPAPGTPVGVSATQPLTGAALVSTAVSPAQVSAAWRQRGY